MAVITEMEESQQQATTSAETGPEALSEASPMDTDDANVDDALLPILARKGPRGVVRAVSDFLSRRSDAFKSDSSVRDLMAVLSAARDREAAAAAAAAEQKSKAEKRPRDKDTELANQASSQASTFVDEEGAQGDGKEEGKAADAGMTEDSGKTSPRTISAGPEEVPEAFPALGIEWPDAADDPGFAEVASQLLKSVEELVEIKPLPSVEKMKSWLEARTRGYHMFGGSQKLWMAKIARLWEEFGRLHSIQRQREQVQAMLQEEMKRHQTLQAVEAEARARSRLLREEADAAWRQAEELTQEAAQSALRISELEKRKA